MADVNKRLASWRAIDEAELDSLIGEINVGCIDVVREVESFVEQERVWEAVRAKVLRSRHQPQAR